MAYDFTAAKTTLLTELTPISPNYAVSVYRGEEQILLFEQGLIHRDTRCPIGSSTKTYSAAIIAKLADRGLFGLSDRLVEHIPFFTASDRNLITLMQCMNMSSGLFSQAQQFQIMPNLDLAQSCQAIGLATPVVTTPGTQISYDGKGIQCVGYAMQLLLGKDWRQIADEELFQPLGMRHTAYSKFGQNPAVAGGIVTTLEDQQRFYAMLLRGGTAADGTQVMTARALGWMFTGWTEALPINFSFWPEDSAYYQYSRHHPNYGFGYWVMATTPTNTAQIEEFCGPGAYGSLPWIDFKRHIRGSIIMNLPNTNENSAVIASHLHFMDDVRTAVDAVALGPIGGQFGYRNRYDLVPGDESP